MSETLHNTDENQDPLEDAEALTGEQLTYEENEPYEEAELVDDETITNFERKQDTLNLIQTFSTMLDFTDKSLTRLGQDALIKQAAESGILSEVPDSEQQIEILEQLSDWLSAEKAQTRYKYPDTIDFDVDQSTAFAEWAESLEVYYFTLILNQQMSVADAQKQARQKFLQYIADTTGEDLQDDFGNVIESAEPLEVEELEQTSQAPEDISHGANSISGGGKGAPTTPGTGKEASTRPGSGKANVATRGQGKAAMPMRRPTSAPKPETSKPTTANGV